MASDTAEALVFRSHFRVCKKLAIPRDMIRLYQRRQTMGRGFLDEDAEVVFLPQTLLRQALYFVRTRMLPHQWLSVLPADLIEQLALVPLPTPSAAQRSGDNEFHRPQKVIAKERSCESIDRATIRIGNFGAHPEALQRPAPELCSVPICEQAAAVLAFLAEVESTKQLEKRAVVAYTVRHRYVPWMRLQAANLGRILVPPLDVAAIWWHHMLQSSDYRRFARAMTRGLELVPHIVLRLLSADDRKAAASATKELWTAFAGLAGQKYDPSWQATPDRDPSYYLPPNAPFLDEMVDDRMWYREFAKATAGVDVRSAAFFERALLGYQRFMYLLAKYPIGMEVADFAPNPAIDLIWHTYLAQPAAYRRDAKRLLGHVVHHKLLPADSRTEMFYHERTSREVDIWKREFNGESPLVYIAPLRPGIDGLAAATGGGGRPSTATTATTSTSGAFAPLRPAAIVYNPTSNFLCDVCEANVDAERIHCTKCKDFDLCPAHAATAFGKHNPASHATIRLFSHRGPVNAPPRAYPLGKRVAAWRRDPATEAQGFVCDVCEHPVNKMRYHCRDCNDYDLCHDCFAKHGPAHGDPNALAAAVGTTLQPIHRFEYLH